MLTCTLTFFTFAQKFNYKCYSYIYIMNYRLQNCIFSCMLCLHNLKMMVNAMVTLQPMVEYSAFHHTFVFQNLFCFFFSNNSTSSSCFHLCSFFYTSFSFATLCNFSITLSKVMLLWILELWIHSQLPTTKENNFRRLPYLFLFLSFPPISFIFLHARCLLINVSSLKLI